MEGILSRPTVEIQSEHCWVLALGAEVEPSSECSFNAVAREGVGGEGSDDGGDGQLHFLGGDGSEGDPLMVVVLIIIIVIILLLLTDCIVSIH